MSLLQRALGIGYGRAARLIDFMAEDGIVGDYAGSQAREVLLTMEDVRRMRSGEGESADATAEITEAAVAAVEVPAEPKPRKRQKTDAGTKQTAEPESGWREDETKDEHEEAESTEMIVRQSELLGDDIQAAFNPALDDDVEDVDDLLETEEDAESAGEELEGEDDEEDDDEYEYEYEDVEGEYEDDPDAEYEYVYEDEEDEDPNAEYEYEYECEDDYEESA